MQNLSGLFEATLKDVYYAEKAILKALPKMEKKASSLELRAAFKKHHQETEGQVKRLEQVFEIMGKRPSGKRCPAIDGIIEEGEEVMKEFTDENIRDAAMLAAAQSVEHYEISRYGTLVAWAGKLNLVKAARLLEQTLNEEKATDESLSMLADTEINDKAEAKEDDDGDRSSMSRAASPRGTAAGDRRR